MAYWRTNISSRPTETKILEQDTNKLEQDTNKLDEQADRNMLGEHSSTNTHTTQTYFQKTASWGLGAEEPKEECPQVHMPACKNVSHTDLERDTGFALDSSVEMHDFACLCIRVPSACLCIRVLVEGRRCANKQSRCASAQGGALSSARVAMCIATTPVEGRSAHTVEHHDEGRLLDQLLGELGGLEQQLLGLLPA